MKLSYDLWWVFKPSPVKSSIGSGPDRLALAFSETRLAALFFHCIPFTQIARVFYIWSSKNTCVFTCEAHGPRWCVSHVKFTMWLFTYETHVKFHMGFFTWKRPYCILPITRIVALFQPSIAVILHVYRPTNSVDVRNPPTSFWNRVHRPFTGLYGIGDE